MPSPRNGSPVTGMVAPGTVVTVVLTGDSTAKSGSVSKLTVAVPAEVVEAGSMTKDVPFHTTTSLDGMILDERKVAVTGCRNVPGYGAPLRVTWIPTATTTVMPAGGVIRLRSAAVTVICTTEGKVPGGTVTVNSTPLTNTGPMVPPAGPTLTVVITAVNPPGGTLVAGGGGPYAVAAAAAMPAVPHTDAAPIKAITDSLPITTLYSRMWAYRVPFAGMKPPRIVHPSGLKRPMPTQCGRALADGSSP